MNNCPHCNRKLLSHASARCNWCGQEILDPAYLAQAETARETFFAAQAAHDAMSLANIERINIDGYDPNLYSWSGAPRRSYRPLTNRQNIPPAPPAPVETIAPDPNTPHADQSAWEQEVAQVMANRRNETKALDQTKPEKESPENTEQQSRFSHLEF